MITVIDLKISNITSVCQALKHLKIDHAVTDKPAGIEQASKLILPGVGDFAEAMRRMQALDLIEPIRQAVVQKKVPIMGICLGMQLFASYGEEGGGSSGLDLIRGKVLSHRASQHNLRLPHIGWNDVRSNGMKLFSAVPEDVCFYFVHSFEFIAEEQVQTATCHYGTDFVAVVQKEHVIGCQFHPEKSQEFGLKLIKNFSEGIF